MSYMKDVSGKRLDTITVARRSGLAPTLRAVLFGDSITARNGALSVPSPQTAIYNDSRGWFHWANMLLGRPFDLVANAGVGGDTTSQMLARISTDVLPYAGSGAWLFGVAGVNDYPNAISTATSIANLKSIFQQAFAAGYERIVWGTVWPDAANFAERSFLDTINDWLFQYAAQTPNFVLVNWVEVFCDPYSATASGSPFAAFTTDTLHPSPLGAATLGQYLAQAIQPLISNTRSRQLMRATSTAINPNPMMSGNVSGVATGFTVAGFTTALKLARVDGLGGDWQMLVATATGANTLSIPGVLVSSGLYAPGDLLYAELEFETDDDWQSCTEFSLQLWQAGDASVGTSVYQSFDFLQNGGVTTHGANPRRGVLRTPDLTILAGVTTAASGQVRAVLTFNGIGTVRVARFSIRKRLVTI